MLVGLINLLLIGGLVVWILAVIADFYNKLK